MRGQLKEILLGINEVMNEQEMNLGGIYRMEFLDDLVRIYSSSVMDGNFLYSPTEGCREFAPQDLVTKEPDFFKRQEKIRRITEKMENILSPAKIEWYVERQLEEKKQLHAAEFPLDTEEDFIKIIYIRLYDQRKNINYKVKSLEEVHIWWQKYLHNAKTGKTKIISIVDSGNAFFPSSCYFGGMVFSSKYDSVMYLSRKMDGLWRIEQWNRRKGAYHFTKLIATSTSNLIRSFVSKNKSILQWSEGFYDTDSFKKADMSIRRYKN